MNIIGRIKTDFPEKFGLPRQSGLIKELKGEIIFEKEYAVNEAVRGLSDYSHIWILWEFSEAKRECFSPTVRPPRLGGETRMGVFATRSPFRPNPIGLSVVKLDSIEYRKNVGPVLLVSGIDLMDGTPIYDIKPYLPHIDSIPDATGGFSTEVKDYALNVVFENEEDKKLCGEHVETVKKILSNDPRPSYQNDENRVYGMCFLGMNIRFLVRKNEVFVIKIEKNKNRLIF